MKLLMATYNFLPEHYGGTETYVNLLARELIRRGHSPEVLCGRLGDPTGSDRRRFSLQEDSYEGLPVWRVQMAGSKFTLRELYTLRAPDLDRFWRDWLKSRRPDVLHINGHSLTVSASLISAAHDAGIPVVFTVHIATLYCARGDYITYRGEVCDGRMEIRKCTECFLATRSGNVAMSRAAGAVSPMLSILPAPNWAGGSFLRTGVFYPALLRARRKSLAQTAREVDLWHVFSRWTAKALESNGVPADRIQLLRHPLPGQGKAMPSKGPAKELRLGFFGRFNRIKGLDVLLDAVELLPDARLRLDVFGAAQGDEEAPLGRRVQGFATRDPRVRLRGRIAQSSVHGALAELHAVVVPSMSIETGPLTVLEAFAARVPVVGSDLSGINEWVEDGRNGLLFPHGNARALAACLERLPGLLPKLCEFPAMQSVEDHCAAMVDLYRRAGSR